MRSKMARTPSDDGETSGRGSRLRKRPSSEGDSFRAKRSRSSTDSNHHNGLMLTAGSTLEETDDSQDSNSQSMLPAIHRSETLESRPKRRSLSKSRSDASQNGEVQESGGAVGKSSFKERPGTTTGQMGAPSRKNSHPKLQTKTSQSNIRQASMRRIPSVQRDTETISGILGVGQDPKVTEKVYNRLSALRTNPRRVEVVTNAVLEEQTAAANHEADHETRSLMDDVQALVQKFPKSDPNELYNLLEAVDPTEDRLQRVTEKLEQRTGQKAGTTTNTNTADQGTADKDQDKSNDDDMHEAFLKDLDIICKIFPDRDRNEIGALLESCPRRKTRVQEVIRRLVNVEDSQDSQESVPMATDKPNTDSLESTESIPMAIDEPNLDLSEPTEPFEEDFIQDPLAQLKEDLDILLAIVPECDPNFLVDELKSRHDNEDRVQEISITLLESNTYPRLKDRLEKEKQEARRQKLFDADINIEEFLETFPEPRETFYDVASVVSDKYRQHAKMHLYNTFPRVHATVITKQLGENNFHLTPTLRRLESIVQPDRDSEPGRGRRGRIRGRRRGGGFRQSDRPQEPLPETLDEYFYQELLFARNEQRITEHMDQVRRDREARVTAARKAGALLTCTCCYEDELVEDDMLPCPDGHIFCRDCIRRMSMEKIGQGLVVVECLEGECQTEFDLNVLQKAMPAKTFSVFLKKKQEEEVKAAGIPDLETCPFCSFATIMPNHEDKVFCCLNPECFRQSCRLCKEPDHVPLRCEEVEQQNETRVRTQLELRMTEAMLRTCPRCKKRFFKVEGCNKMTCTCGQSMCYICRKPVKGYDHFQKGRCNLHDMNALHKDEMMAAGQEVLGELQKEHPHMNITLDPETILGDKPKAKKKAQPKARKARAKRRRR